MTNIEDFLQWWDGFRAGIGRSNMTKEHLDLINEKINGLRDLWDIELPTREEQYDDGQPWWKEYRPYMWPALPTKWPSLHPDIWCGTMPHVGTPINPPKVGTPSYTHIQ